jgi:hypothetical protein
VLFLGVSGNYRIGISGSEGTYRLGLGTGKGRLDPTLGTRGDGSIYGPTESLADMDLTGDETLTLDWETLRKYDANGELSTTFGTAGEVSISTVVGGGGGAVRVQPDGRIVVAARGPASPYPWLVARFEGDGTLDSSFGTNGIAEVSPGGTGSGSMPLGIRFQQNGGDLDVDVSLTGLLSRALNLREWAPRIMGQVRSEAKASAARRNGLKGGRPPGRTRPKEGKAGVARR